MRLFEVSDLGVDIHSGEQWRPAVRNATFAVDEGESLAIVGESGSGKSLMAIGAVDLLGAGAKAVAGKTIFDGNVLQEVSAAEWQTLVGLGIGVLFQDPVGSWDPLIGLGEQTAEVLAEHYEMSSDEIRDRVTAALGEVKLPGKRRFLTAFSREISRGEAQRAMLAATLISGPKVLIADEPFSGLDPTVARSILDIIDDLRHSRGLAMIVVTHDLGVVAAIADRVAVVYGGRIVEEGPVDLIFHQPKHPYTAGLLASLPAMGRRLQPIPGDAPDIAWMDPGCPFAPRCSYEIDRCRDDVPDVRFVGGSAVRCIRAGELALKGV